MFKSLRQVLTSHKERVENFDRQVQILSELYVKMFFPGQYPRKPNSIYGGQPLAISIEPTITLNVYPDHPHLNSHGEPIMCIFTI
ncbi:MAG: hypothetical protein KAX49_07760 [Halanaerobiales bacterium]|nr:hypothetical protein [Halanaerobiales bacterium]